MIAADDYDHHMRLAANNWLKSVLAVALLALWSAGSIVAPSAGLAKVFTINGTADCRSCHGPLLPFWTDSLGSMQRIELDFSWLPDELEDIDRGDYLEVEVEELDGRYVVLRVVHLGE